MHVLYRELKGNPEWDSLWKLGLWCVGEYCLRLLNSITVGERSFASISWDNIVELLDSVINSERQKEVKEYAVTALGKIGTMIDAAGDEVRSLLSLLALNSDNELQQRACELSILLELEYNGIRRSVIQQVPSKIEMVVPESNVEASGTNLLDFEAERFIDVYRDNT